MPTNLTGTQIKDTYAQILHVDGGPEATEKVVYSAVGVATALKVGTGSASVDNIRLDGNTISTLNTNGNLVLSPNGTGSVVIPSVTFSTPAQARTSLGLGTIATQAANSVAITGGAIDGAAIGFSSVSTIRGSTVLATQGAGYTTGAGGTVTQPTSRTTGVTLNQACGQITLFPGSLAAHEADEFTLTNSEIAATDVVIVNIKLGAAAGTRKYYTVAVTSVSAGSCTISVGNNDNSPIPSTGTDTLVLSFAVIKGVTS